MFSLRCHQLREWAQLCTAVVVLLVGSSCVQNGAALVSPQRPPYSPSTANTFSPMPDIPGLDQLVGWHLTQSELPHMAFVKIMFCIGLRQTLAPWKRHRTINFQLFQNIWLLIEYVTGHNAYVSL